MSYRIFDCKRYDQCLMEHALKDSRKWSCCDIDQRNRVATIVEVEKRKRLVPYHRDDNQVLCTPETVGKRVYDELKKSSLSIKQICRLAKVEPKQVYQLRYQRNRIGETKLIRLAEVLNVSASYIITGEDKVGKNPA